MKEKYWEIPYHPITADDFAGGTRPPLLEAVLRLREIPPQQAECFLHPAMGCLDDPMKLKDMPKAVERIRRAMANHEKVAIYGDYDVDGITSLSLLYSYLTGKGVDCVAYIPDRIDEGYGVNQPAVEAFANDGVNLIITVDCGITAAAETDYAASRGVDLIITDHHECRGFTLPRAVAVVDPKREDCTYGFDGFCGCGVAFKLVCALEGDTESVLERYADLVAVGTVADVMPLNGENRYLVQRGLQKLAENPRPGLAALIAKSLSPGKEITASTISFTLAPRINAAGRLGRTDPVKDRQVLHLHGLVELPVIPADRAPVIDRGGLDRTECGRAGLEVRIGLERLADHLLESVDRKLAQILVDTFDFETEAGREILLIADHDIHKPGQTAVDRPASLFSAVGFPEGGTVVQVIGDDGPVFAGRGHRLLKNLGGCLGEGRIDTAGMEPAHPAAAEEILPIDITRFQLGGGRMSAVADTQGPADSESALGKVKSDTGGCADAVKGHPVDHGCVHATHHNQVLGQFRDIVIQEGRHHTGFETEAFAEASRDVILSASLPDVERAGSLNPSLTRIKAEHHFSQGDLVKFALRTVFQNQFRHN